MNTLTCNHEFDFSLQLLSSPPQVRCKHCRMTAFVEHAQQFTNAINESKITKRIEAEAVFELECRELWKNSALAFLATGQTTRDHDGKLTSSAAGVADCIIKHFKSRFGVLS